jgi:hypothetical protein
MTHAEVRTVNPLLMDTSTLSDLQFRARYRHLEHLRFCLPNEEKNLARTALKGMAAELDNHAIQIDPFNKGFIEQVKPILEEQIEEKTKRQRRK